jgi:hypothetical protein
MITLLKARYKFDPDTPESYNSQSEFARGSVYA